MSIIREDRPWTYTEEGHRWLETDFFKINPGEDNVDGGRSYIHVEGKNGGIAMVRDESSAEDDGNGFSWIEFDKPYVLSDSDGHREEIEVLKVPGNYKVGFRPALPMEPETGGWLN